MSPSSLIFNVIYSFWLCVHQIKTMSTEVLQVTTNWHKNNFATDFCTIKFWEYYRIIT